MYFRCIFTLLKFVSHYDLSVLSMSVMCFQKKFWYGVGGWCILRLKYSDKISDFAIINVLLMFIWLLS